MTGWVRLWIFVSLLWLLTTAIYVLSGIYNVDKLITPHDEAVVRMGESRRFYSDLEVGQPGPRYDFVFSVAQGVDVVINGPVSKEVAIRQVEQALEDAVSEAPGTRVYFSGTFSSELALKVERLNEAAMAAMRKYEAEKTMYLEERTNYRIQLAKKWGLVAFIPPILFGVLIVGFRWVKAGF